MVDSSGGTYVELVGIRIDKVTLNEAIALIVKAIASGRGGTVVTPNLDHLAAIFKGKRDRAPYSSATLVLADGLPLVWASRIADSALPERVAGSDLLLALLREAEMRQIRVAFIGGLPDRETELGEKVAALYPQLQVVTVISPPFGFSANDNSAAEISKKLQSAMPSLVFTGLGSPLQEHLNQQLAVRLPNVWFLGVGGGIDMISGRTRKAPRWVSASGLEWLFRLAQEPHRLAGRYLVRDLPFLYKLILRAARSRRDAAESNANGPQGSAGSKF